MCINWIDVHIMCTDRIGFTIIQAVLLYVNASLIFSLSLSLDLVWWIFLGQSC